MINKLLGGCCRTPVEAPPHLLERLLKDAHTALNQNAAGSSDAGGLKEDIALVSPVLEGSDSALYYRNMVDSLWHTAVARGRLPLLTSLKAYCIQKWPQMQLAIQSTVNTGNESPPSDPQAFILLMLSRRNAKSQTTLMLACMHGRAEVVKFLLQQGVDPWDTDRGDRVALHYAAFSGHASCVRALLSGIPAKAASRGAVRYVDARVQAGATALHFAAASCSVSALETLLEHGADYSLCSSGQTWDAHIDTAAGTPLHVAALQGDRACALALLRLYHAACSGNSQPPQVASGASPVAPADPRLQANKAGQLPHQLAAQHRHVELAELLRPGLDLRQVLKQAAEADGADPAQQGTKPTARRTSPHTTNQKGATDADKPHPFDIYPPLEGEVQPLCASVSGIVINLRKSNEEQGGKGGSTASAGGSTNVSFSGGSRSAAVAEPNANLNGTANIGQQQPPQRQAGPPGGAAVKGSEGAQARDVALAVPGLAVAAAAREPGILPQQQQQGGPKRVSPPSGVAPSQPTPSPAATAMDASSRRVSPPGPSSSGSSRVSPPGTQQQQQAAAPAAAAPAPAPPTTNSYAASPDVEPEPEMDPSRRAFEEVGEDDIATDDYDSEGDSDYSTDDEDGTGSESGAESDGGGGSSATAAERAAALAAAEVRDKANPHMLPQLPEVTPVAHMTALRAPALVEAASISAPPPPRRRKGKHRSSLRRRAIRTAAKRSANGEVLLQDGSSVPVLMVAGSQQEGVSAEEAQQQQQQQLARGGALVIGHDQQHGTGSMDAGMVNAGGVMVVGR